MNNNYIVVYSSDSWLLARLSTDLMMAGVKDHREWNERIVADQHYLHTDHLFGFELNNNDWSPYDPIRLTLTEKNYVEVLSQIIE